MVLWKNGKIFLGINHQTHFLRRTQQHQKVQIQKKGRRGTTLHHESTGRNGAVAALECRLYHNLSNKWTEENILCDVWRSKACTQFTSGDIFKAVRTATKIVKLQEKGIDPDIIGEHSIRAGGALALKIMEYQYSTIKNLADGRQIHGKCISNSN